MSEDEQDAATAPPRRRGRWAFLLLAGLALAVGAPLLGNVPREQQVRIVLGAAAPSVQEVRLRYAERAQRLPVDPRGPEESQKWLREVTFRYPKGQAPRVLVHRPPLPDGEYDIEIDVLGPENPATIERHGTFTGDPLTLDVAETLRR